MRQESSKYVFPVMVISLLMSIGHAEEQRIYQTDSLGNVQYHKPSYTIQQDGRIIETDAYGKKQYHKQQYQIKGDRVYQTDSTGKIQYHRLSQSLTNKK